MGQNGKSLIYRKTTRTVVAMGKSIARIIFRTQEFGFIQPLPQPLQSSALVEITTQHALNIIAFAWGATSTSTSSITKLCRPGGLLASLNMFWFFFLVCFFPPTQPHELPQCIGIPGLHVYFSLEVTSSEGTYCLFRVASPWLY